MPIKKTNANFRIMTKLVLIAGTFSVCIMTKLVMIAMTITRFYIFVIINMNHKLLCAIVCFCSFFEHEGSVSLTCIFR